MVPACEEVGLQVHKELAYEEAGLHQEVFNQSNIGCQEFSQVKKVEATVEEGWRQRQV